MTGLPFAPLTLPELRARHTEALSNAGMRCLVVAEDDGEFRPSDVAHVLKQGRIAGEYLSAAESRRVSS